MDRPGRSVGVTNAARETWQAVIGWWFEGVSGGGIAWTMVGGEALIFFRAPHVSRDSHSTRASRLLPLVWKTQKKITPVLQATKHGTQTIDKIIEFVSG